MPAPPPLNLESPAMRRVLLAIRDASSPFTVADLSARAHYDVNTLRSRVVPALQRLGLMHIAGWEKVDRGRWPALYMSGPGDPPSRQPWKARKVEHARKWKADHGYHALQTSRATAERKRKRAAAAPSALAALLSM